MTYMHIDQEEMMYLINIYFFGGQCIIIDRFMKFTLKTKN